MEDLPHTGRGLWQTGRVQAPKKMTEQELAEHLRLLKQAGREDLDELLTDLLCHIYKTRDTQDS